jgi:hypothetical protein
LDKFAWFFAPCFMPKLPFPIGRNALKDTTISLFISVELANQNRGRPLKIDQHHPLTLLTP